MPREKNDDQPRASFSSNEISRILRELETLVIQGDQIISGCPISYDLLSLIGLLAYSGLRPTEKELYALRHADVDVVSNKKHPHLVLTIRQSKTIPRSVITQAEAKNSYEKFLRKIDQSTAVPVRRRVCFFSGFPRQEKSSGCCSPTI